MLHVLIVEDSETDTKLLLHELRRAGHEVEFERVEDEPAMRAALARAPWDVVLSDWAMPRFSAPDALRVLKESSLDIPFIIVSGTVGEDAAVEAMRSGAQDYVLKQKLTRLVPAVERELRDRGERESRRRAEQALRAAQARYRRIVETTSEGVWIIDAEHKTSFMNAKMAQMLGYRIEEVLSRPIYDFLRPEDRDAVAKILEMRRSGVQSERLLRRKDGTTFWSLVESSAIFDETGGYEGSLALVMDVSERKRAEEEIRASEERFRQLAESIREVFWLTDPGKGSMIYVSPAYETIWGRSVEKLYGSPRDWVEAIHADDRDRVLDAALTRQASGAYDEEYRIVRPDGSIRWIRDRAFPVRDAAGRVIRIAGVAEDVTQARQLEQQLLQAQKMEAVGQLAGGIAHDFNNLLAVILSSSSFLLEELNPTDPRREDAEEIKLAAERAATLTRQLLAFSRRQVLESRIIDLNSVVQGLEKMLRRLIGEDVELTTSLAAGLGKVRADAGQIEQVILNLAVNARDAMPGGGKLRIETANVELDESYAFEHASAQAGSYVLLAISDTGVGIDHETQRRMFEPFFTTKEKGKGTGLGLSTSYGIVKQSNGYIWVYSEPGRGTVFKVYLPRVEGDVDRPAERKPPMDVRGTETILLVEDDERVRAVAQKILQSRGYQVFASRDAAQALGVAAEHSWGIDLLVTDVVMPGTSGVELAERLRSERPGAKVLFMSGYMDRSFFRDPIDPALNLLQKPFTPETLTRKVRQILDS